MEELDLFVPDMSSAEAEQKAAEALRTLPGVSSVRVVDRGIWLAYRAEAISQEEICEALRREGFRVSVFQDSKTGKTGAASS